MILRVSGDISYQEWVEEQGYLPLMRDRSLWQRGRLYRIGILKHGLKNKAISLPRQILWQLASGYATETWVEEQGYSTVSGIEGLEEYLSVDDFEGKTVLISGAVFFK